MTTQYTPTLKLALPVTGELSGTWGDTVNDNITSMIEQAIAGLSTINTWTANAHTLTTANGTTSESRCAMLVAATGGGAPTAAADIICPAAAKLYVLQNNTSFAVTLKTSAGTGVAVAAGDTAFLFCDATNVNSCVTTIVNGNITGNLTVGGNATINGNTTLGNATSDTITATARFNTDLVPSTDNARDLGSAANSWKDLFIDGTATMALVAISGGTINGVSIGATTAATLINVDNLRLDGNTLSSTDTNGNVVIAPNGTGDVQLDADTVRVGDAAAAATLTSNGAGALTVTTGGAADLTLSTNSGTTSGTVVIANGANGNITLTPDGTGDVILSADRVQMGDSNTDTTLTTNGTGSLNLTTNNGTNSGTVQIAQGVNGNITLTPNGTGSVSISKLYSSGNTILGATSANTLSVAATITSNLLFTDATYDIGASGATRPRDLFLSRNLTVGGTLTLTGGVNLNGNVTVGDSSADTLTINSTITSNLIFTDNTYDIGASGATRPRTLYLGTSLITPAITNSGLTSGRVTYAGTGGLLQDSANLTFNGSTLTITGGVILSGDITQSSTSARITYSNATTAGNGGLQNNTGGSYVLLYPSTHTTKPNHTDIQGTSAVNILVGSGIGTFTSTGLAVTGTLSATGVATFSAGTVALPAITTTGDTNTGIFFPAADTIAFTEGGAEAMRITSAGNLLVNATSAAAATTYLQVSSTSGNGNDAYIGIFTGGSGATSANHDLGVQFGTTLNSIRTSYDGSGNARNDLVFTVNSADVGSLTSSGLSVSMAMGVITLTSTTGTNAAYQSFVNTGGTYYNGVDNSTGAAFSGVAYAMFRYAPSGRVIKDVIAGTGAITTISATGVAVTGTLSSTGNATIGNATAATNVTLNLNGVVNKAQRIVFQNSGAEQWLIGAGAASETSAFEIYNSNGNMSLSINKSTSVSSFGAGIQITPNSVAYASTSPFMVQGHTYTADFSIANATAQIIGTRMTNDAWNPTLNIVTARQSLTAGSLSFGGIGFSTIDVSNSAGMRDGARIAIVNESTAAVASPTAMAFYTNLGSATQTFPATEWARISSTGVLMVGTTAGVLADGNFVVAGSNGAGQGAANTVTQCNFYEKTSGGLNGLWIGAMTNETTAVIGSRTATGNIAFQTYNSGWGERMRLTNTGNLLVGATTSFGSGFSTFQYLGATYNGISVVQTDNASGSRFMTFAANGASCGVIDRVGTTSAVVYTATSDYRLKNVTGAVTGQGERIDALKPIDYRWKEDNSQTRGFLAHEFQTVYPNSVTGAKDAINADGKPVYQAMQAATSEVIADLVAEIQSLRKRLAAANL